MSILFVVAVNPARSHSQAPYDWGPRMTKNKPMWYEQKFNLFLSDLNCLYGELPWRLPKGRWFILVGSPPLCPFTQYFFLLPGNMGTMSGVLWGDTGIKARAKYGRAAIKKGSDPTVNVGLPSPPWMDCQRQTLLYMRNSTAIAFWPCFVFLFFYVTKSSPNRYDTENI